MGASTSTCISGQCSKDNSAEFSDVLSNTREDDTFHVIQTIDPKSNTLAPDLPGTPQRDHISTPDSGSKQSVFTEISPTKDRSSPSRHNNSTVSELQLYSDSLDEFVGTWTELHDIIKNGSVQELSAYTALTRMDLPMIWFKDKHRTPLHLAVLYNRQDMVEYLLDQGLNTNARDDDGVAAVGLAYETGACSEIINMLLSSKASQFANSPYSPYALSVASTVRSVQLRKQAECCSTNAMHTDHTDRLDVVSVRSDPPSVGSRTPRSRTHSLDIPRERRLTNTPLTQYRQNLTPTEAFLSHQQLLRVTETLDQLGRHRSNSLPANAPMLDNIAVRARRPTDPPAIVQSQVRSPQLSVAITTPLLIPCPVLLQDADYTPGEDGSPRSSLTQPSAYGSSAGSVDGTGKPPRDPKKPRKPIGTRLRKAAGRAMSMILPSSSSTGMPPRAPLHPITGTATRPLSTTLMSGITTASAHDDTADEDQQIDTEVHQGVPKQIEKEEAEKAKTASAVAVAAVGQEAEEEKVDDDDMAESLHLSALYAQGEREVAV